MTRRGGGPQQACRGKVAHPTREAAHPTREAADHARNALAGRGAAWWTLGIYRCPYGTHWHIGHHRGRRR